MDTIPGIGRAAAEIIIAETGGDTAHFATAGHLTYWIWVCPGMIESAGVNKSSRNRSGNSNLKRILGVAAMSVNRSKDTYLSTYYHRVASRRGSLRALVAVLHKLAIAI
nr:MULTISPECIES: transposase [unclassified Streptomyces]